MDKPNNGDSPANGAQPVRRAGRPKGSKNRPRLAESNILSPKGVKKLTSDLVRQRASVEDRERYVKMLNEVPEDLVIVKNALHRLADNLETIKRDRLYYAGGYATFGDFCQAEIGSRQQAYRLLAAREVLENLLEAGFKEHELPDHERLCRALKKCPPKVQDKVWGIVLKHVDVNEVTSEDVENAAAELGVGGSKPDKDDENEEDNSEEELETEQRQQDSDELIREWETLAKKLRVGLDRETLTKPAILRLAAVLTDIHYRSEALLATLKKAQEPGTAKEAIS